MKKMSDEKVDAFPLKSQYIKSIDQAREAAGGEEPHEIDDDDDDEVPGPTVKTKKPKAKSKPAAKRKATVGKDGKPWDYGKVRVKFIKNARSENGDLSYEDAKQLWDESSEKKNFLKDVSVQELKRRKFLPKGCTENPWAK